MGETSSIEWTDATVNFWWGCTKVGPGCDNCYAEDWAKRFGGDLWGPGVPRRKIKGAVKLLHRLDNDYSEWASDACAWPHLNIPLRRRVFIQSMSDLFDREVPLEWFAEGWRTMEVCNRVDLQIVTKRVSAVEKRLAAIGRTTWPRHAGLIITVVDQDEAARDLPRLRTLKARLGIPWVGLSVEPMLAAMDITPWLDFIDWVIVGGESGRAARPINPDWVRALRDQCTAAGVAFFFKQWGEWLPVGQTLPGCGQVHGATAVKAGRMKLHYGGSAHEAPKHAFEERGVGAAAMADGRLTFRVGRKRAGRLLDGVVHDALPEPARAAA